MRRIINAVRPPARGGTVPAVRGAQLAIAAASCTSLKEMEEAHVARILDKKDGIIRAEEDRARRYAIFLTYRGPAAQVMSKIWKTCANSHGGHTFVESKYVNNVHVKDVCDHCEMPKASRARERSIDDVTKSIQRKAVEAGELEAKDLWTS